MSRNGGAALGSLMVCRARRRACRGFCHESAQARSGTKRNHSPVNADRRPLVRLSL